MLKLPVRLELRACSTSAMLPHGRDRLPRGQLVIIRAHGALCTNATAEQGEGGGWSWGALPESCSPQPWRWLLWLLPLRQPPQGGIEAGAAVHALHVAAHVHRAQLQSGEPLAPRDAGHPPAQGAGGQHPAGCSCWAAMLVKKGSFSAPVLLTEEKAPL